MLPLWKHTDLSVLVPPPLPPPSNTHHLHTHIGARLRCIDAPVKLQERWVQGLISSFTDSLDEQAINSYAPVKDFRANQQIVSTLPAAALAWDQQLAQAAAELQQQATAAAAQAQGSGGFDSAAAAAAKQAAEHQALLLFKVSKATAAALLPPHADQQAEVLGRMARLQPLKWRHFALRQQFMAQQIKEAAALATKQAQARSSSSRSAIGGSSSRQNPTLLVVVGRQHAAALHAAWSNPSSILWRTNVPRSFVASVVEPPEVSTEGAGAAAAGPAGGSSGAGEAPPAGT
jgi:hypothetical protein